MDFSHIYPKENKDLSANMAKDHLLLTEYPPYVRPKKWHFPMRNRIISGLSEGTSCYRSNSKKWYINYN